MYLVELSLMPRNIEHIFTCLLATCSSSLRTACSPIKLFAFLGVVVYLVLGFDQLPDVVSADFPLILLAVS